MISLMALHWGQDEVTVTIDNSKSACNPLPATYSCQNTIGGTKAGRGNSNSVVGRGNKRTIRGSNR